MDLATVTAHTLRGRAGFRATYFLGIALVAILATGCGDGSGGAGRAGRGGTIVVGRRSDFGGFNSITNVDLYTTEAMNFGLFTPLVQYEKDLTVKPWLAQSWDLEGDTAVVFHLRHDVRWHDGPPVTATDVKFTFDRAKDPASASLIGSAFLSEVAAAAVVDSFTIRFSFARPHAQALEDFWWAPMPEHLLRDTPAAEMRNAPFNRQPVGSGPFRFVEWRANEQLVLERNDAFAAGLGGAPAASRIVFRVVPEASTLLTEVLTGNVHIDIPLGPDQVERVRQDDQLKLFSFPGRTVYYIGWNDARPPFDNPAVRRGLAMAIDRRTIIDGLLHGQGAIATSTIPPWHPSYPGDVEPLAFSLEEAGRTLDAAGWTDRDGDGIRENAQGRPLRFTLLASDDVLRRSVVEVLQSQFRRVGVDAQVRLTEFQTMIAAHRGRDFDAVFTNWVLDNFQVASSPFALFHSSQASVPGSSNRSSVKIPALDRLIDRGRSATDLGERRRIWRDFTEVLQREQPVSFMFWLNELAAVNMQVEGVEMDPRGELLTMPRWSMSER